MTKLKIAIADDHTLFRKSLAMLIDSFGDMQVVLEAANGSELLRGMDNSGVQILLLDIQMPVLDGYETCTAVRQRFPEIKILMLSQLSSSESISRTMELGANGYFTKNTDPEHLHDAITSIDSTGFYFEKGLGSALRDLLLDNGHIRPLSLAAPLTEREVKIIELSCLEYSNRQIGDKVFLSPRTVEGYKARMIEKLDTNSFLGVIIYAIRHGIVKIETLDS